MEGINLFRRNNIFYYIIFNIIKILFSYLLITIVFNNVRATYRTNVMKNTIINTNYIKIYDTYGTPGNQPYSEFISNEDSLGKLNYLYENLLHENNFTFYEINNNLIQIEGNYTNGYDFIDDSDSLDKNSLNEFINQELVIDNKLSTFTNIKNMLIGKQTFANLKLANSIYLGRALISSDYTLKNRDEIINVNLGYRYKDIYDVGDEFTALYLGERLHFRVVGIFQEDSVINLGNKVIYLDYSVIMPFFNTDIYNVKKDDLSFFTKHYTYKIWGYLSVDDIETITDIINQFNSLAAQSGLNFYGEPLGASYSETDLLSASSINKELLIFSSLIISIACFIICFIFCRNFNRNMKTYSIHLLNGATLKSIKTSIYVKMFLQFILCYVFSISMFYIINRKFISVNMFVVSSNVALIIELIFYFFSFLITNFYINNTEIYTSLRRSE